MSLEGLSDDESNMLLNTYSNLSSEQKETIIQKANGNPLFLKELAANVTATGELVLPDTINDVVTMRIDALDNDTKEVVRKASIIGHSFEYETLQHLIQDSAVV